MNAPAQQPPRLCFIGPMVGINPGHVTTQGELISGRFKAAGWSVRRASSHPNRYHRLLDIVWTLIAHCRAIDVLIVHTFGGPSFVIEDIASFLGKLFGLRLIMFLHGGALPTFMARFPRWSRRVLGRADIIAAPSEYLAKAIRPYGLTARVIPNCIELDSYPYRHRTELQPKLFWMRSFHEVWNPLMAVRVLARVCEQHPNATLVMAGQDKGLLEEARRLAHELGVGDRVSFPGYLNLDGKIAHGMAADLFINTNRIDNMPVAVVEACAMGMVVVTTNVGGIPDLLTDGENALLVASEDDEAMAAAILRLLADPTLAARLSANGKALAARSSWARVRLQWEAMFNELFTEPSDLTQRDKGTKGQRVKQDELGAPSSRL